MSALSSPLRMKMRTTKASRPTPNSVGQFSAKLGGGAAHAQR
jgi:hypothetical protein